MKLKIVVVDFEIPMKVKKWAVRAGIPAVILTAAAVAWADTLHTWNTGDTLQATDLNGNFANLQAQITTLQSQVHPASAFRAVRTTAVNVPSAVGTTVAFDNVLFDLGSEYNMTTGAFTPKSAGTYLVTCALQWTAGASSGGWSVTILHSAGEIIDYDVAANTATGSSEATALVQLSAGDAVHCAAQQDTGVSQTLYVGDQDRNSFSAARLY